MNSAFHELVRYNIGGGWGTSAAQPESESAGYVIRGTDIPRVAVGDVSTVPLRFHKASNLSARKLQAGDIVFEVSGGSKGQPVGRALFITDKVLGKFDQPVMCASFCKLIRLDPARVQPGYLFRVLQTTYANGGLDTFQVQSTGITNFKWKPFLEHFKIELPAPEVQRRVASVLETFDDLIENNLRRVEMLEEMARAIYREWFVKFRYSGHEDVPMVDSALGPIPAGWRVCTVGDLCSRIQAGATPKRSESVFWDDPEIDWYKTGDLTDSVLIHSSEQISRIALLKGRVFEPETILMAIYGSPTVGRLGLLASTSSANQAALGLVADSNLATTEYLWFVLEGLRVHLNAIAQGAAQQNVSKEKVATTKVLLPPTPLVSEFTEAVRDPWRLSHVLQRETGSLAELRDLLLPKLVTGQIDVSTLDLDALVAERVA